MINYDMNRKLEKFWKKLRRINMEVIEYYNSLKFM